MAIDFPNSPATNDTYTVGSRTWTWTGTIWELKSGAVGAGTVGTTDLANNAVTQAKLASTLSGTTICTSSTRPGSPFDGQSIYETDTDKTLVWNGSAWYANWNSAWGQVGYASRSTAFTLSATSTDVTGLSVTWTAISGRMYKTTAFVYFSVGAGTGSLFVTVADGSGVRVAEGGTYAAAISYPSVNVTGYTTGLSGSQTRKVRSNFLGITSASTLAASDYPSVIIVEDIGPA